MLRFSDERPVAHTDFDPPPDAPAVYQLRGTLSGAVPGLSSLSYLISADYQHTKRAPYGVGPLSESLPGFTAPELSPLPRFKAIVGLQLNLR